MLFHKMIRDPEGIKALLDALRPRRPAVVTGEAPTELARRRQDRRGAS
jgi:hypothetical protein